MAIAVCNVQFCLQVFLITDGQPINMADYEGLILLEEHIDGVSLFSNQWCPPTTWDKHTVCIDTRQTANTGYRFCVW